MRAEPLPLHTSSDVLPSIFVIGFPKTGSTTLHERFVAAGAMSATVKEPSVLLLDDDQMGDPTSAYRRYYPDHGTRPRIDASPYYIYDTRALSRLAALGTATNIVVSVREPWSRLRSAYIDQFTQGYERRSLNDALLDELGQPVGTIVRADREVSRRYIETTCYGEYVLRLLEGPLGDRVRLVAAETLDDPSTIDALVDWTGLTMSGGPERANTANETTSAMPAFVYGAAARVSAHLPAWLHQRLAPVAKPAMAKLASIPIPNRRRPDLDVDHETTDRVDERLRTSSASLCAIDASTWAGPMPSWVSGSQSS